MRRLVEALKRELTEEACGQCFYFAVQLARKHLMDDTVQVVHGTVAMQQATKKGGKWVASSKRIPHAWVEVHGKVFDWQTKDQEPNGIPLATYYKTFKAKPERKYPPAKALGAAVRNGHYGPWNESRELGEASVAKHFRGLAVGKKMPADLYVHSSALKELPEALRAHVAEAFKAAGKPKFDIAKIAADGTRVSFSVYKDFDTDPHPALLYSTMVKGKNVTETDYSARENPPILHRKETFVGKGYPHYERFKELSDAEDEAGLLGGNDIGTRNGWDKMLKRKRCSIRDHKLIRQESAGQPSSFEVESRNRLHEGHAINGMKIVIDIDASRSTLIRARSTVDTNKAGTDWRTYGTLQISWGKGVGAVTDVRVLGDFARRGIATKMYELAAKLAHDRGVPLVSDKARFPGAEEFWKKQVAKGRAKMVELEPGVHPNGHGPAHVYQLNYPPPPSLESVQAEAGVQPREFTVQAGPVSGRVTMNWGSALDAASRLGGRFKPNGTVEFDELAFASIEDDIGHWSREILDAINARTKKTVMSWSETTWLKNDGAWSRAFSAVTDAKLQAERRKRKRSEGGPQFGIGKVTVVGTPRYGRDD